MHYSICMGAGGPCRQPSAARYACKLAHVVAIPGLEDASRSCAMLTLRPEAAGFDGHGIYRSSGRYDAGAAARHFPCLQRRRAISTHQPSVEIHASWVRFFSLEQPLETPKSAHRSARSLLCRVRINRIRPQSAEGVTNGRKADLWRGHRTTKRRL